MIDRFLDKVNESCVGKVQALWSLVMHYTSFISKTIIIRVSKCVIMRYKSDTDYTNSVFKIAY